MITAVASVPSAQLLQHEYIDIISSEVPQQIVNGYNSDLRVVSWKAKLGTKTGDNYMSTLYAVELVLEEKENGARETLHVMLKTLPRNVYRAEMINDLKAFKVESSVYQEVLPILIQVQEEMNIPPEDLFVAWPICYAIHLDGQKDFLAIENLKVSGYSMGNRVTGLDFNHCASVLRSLARFHAISFVKFGGSREKILESFPLLNNNMFDESNKVTELSPQFYTQSFKSMEIALRKIGEDLASSRVAKMAEVDPYAFLGDLLTKHVKCAVVTHGDCWVNNIMFKYSEKDAQKTCPVGVKFIDFQISIASSRLTDIYYFLMTSSQFDILNEREQDLLMIYFAEFTRFVERFGINTKEKGLTWKSFLEEADKYRIYGVFMSLLFAPMLALDSADFPDMDAWTPEDFENVDDAVKTFCGDLTDQSVIRKVKNILIYHLPKCSNVTQFLV